MTNCHTNLEFEHKGVRFKQIGINLVTNMVKIKNLESGKVKEIDYYKLKKFTK